MNLVSCQRCLTVLDVEIAPVKKTEHGARRDIRAFTQEDVNCPKCGALILRKLNGQAVEADASDPRVRVADSIHRDPDPEDD